MKEVDIEIINQIKSLNKIFETWSNDAVQYLYEELLKKTNRARICAKLELEHGVKNITTNKIDEIVNINKKKLEELGLNFERSHKEGGNRHVANLAGAETKRKRRGINK